MQSSNLFATFDSFDELMEYIEKFSSKEKALAYQIMMMTINTYNKILDEQS